VFVQAIDPAAFGGAEGFARQMDWLVDACHEATPRPGGARVRIPGENGLARYRAQRANGVALHPTIMPALQVWATKLAIDPPRKLDA
jgi:LDH2 family malate/lactate/ureidoglycolate dehydrogenase